MVGMSDPGECAKGTDDEGDVGERSNDEDRVGVHRMVSEVVHNLEEEPSSPGQGTAAVNTS